MTEPMRTRERTNIVKPNIIKSTTNRTNSSCPKLFEGSGDSIRAELNENMALSILAHPNTSTAKSGRLSLRMNAEGPSAVEEKTSNARPSYVRLFKGKNDPSAASCTTNKAKSGHARLRVERRKPSFASARRNKNASVLDNPQVEAANPE